MSLIIEALKRARDDAIRRQAAARGLPLAPVPRMQERRRWLSFAVVPLAAALVICLLLLIDLYSRLPEPEQIESTTAAAETSPPPITSTAVVPESGETAKTSLEASPALTDSPPVPSIAAPAPQVQEGPEPVPPRETTTPSDAFEEPATPQVSARSVASAPAPRPATSESQKDTAVPGAAREFVGQATLRDGQLVDLEGIAWSESEPFALLNGQVIGVGEFIRAYQVSEIQRDHVILEQDEDRILLRLE